MRKLPRQERSRLMVERIISAGRRVLVRDGYARFATHRVAEAAGVSPGSLYQYFRDKEELLTVILDEYWDEAADRVAASLADRFADPPELMIRNVVQGLLSALEKDSQLLRVAVDEVPPQRLQERRQALRRRVQDLASAYLGSMTRSTARRVSTRAWIIVVSMEGLAVRWVIDRPDVPRAELVEELTALAENYIGAPPKTG